jgi:type III secretory pathway component EscV
MAADVKESEIQAELTPETIDLSVVEQTMYDETLAELNSIMQKNQQLQMAVQQTQQMLQNNNVEFNGLVKAFQKMIIMKVRTVGMIGDYTYDNQKKCLTRNKAGVVNK